MAFVVLLGVIASPIATSVANRKLSELQDFDGKVEAVSVAVWRGAIETRDFVLRARADPDDFPVVKARRATMKVSWRSLLRGRLGGRILVDGAEITIVKRVRFAGPVDAAKRAESEIKEHKDEVRKWQDVLREAFPMEISRFELRDGRVRFVDRTHHPHVDLGVNSLEIVATDLRNRPEGEAMPAKVRIRGVTTGDGQLLIVVQADPVARPPNFFATLELHGQQLPPVNPFMLAYANADVSRGTFELYTEVRAEGGGYHGYTKPFFRDLDFRTASDKDKTAARRLAEKAIAVAAEALKNEDKEKVATKAPFSGTFKENQVDVWATVENLLRNAFVQSLREGLEGQEPSK